MVIDIRGGNTGCPRPGPGIIEWELFLGWKGEKSASPGTTEYITSVLLGDFGLPTTQGCSPFFNRWIKEHNWIELFSSNLQIIYFCIYIWKEEEDSKWWELRCTVKWGVRYRKNQRPTWEKWRWPGSISVTCLSAVHHRFVWDLGAFLRNLNRLGNWNSYWHYYYFLSISLQILPFLIGTC